MSSDRRWLQVGMYALSALALLWLALMIFSVATIESAITEALQCRGAPWPARVALLAGALVLLGLVIGGWKTRSPLAWALFILAVMAQFIFFWGYPGYIGYQVSERSGGKLSCPAPPAAPQS